MDLIQFSTDYGKSFSIGLKPAVRFHNNSSDLSHLTHPNGRILDWLRTSCQQGNKWVAKRSWACVKAQRLQFEHL